MMEGEQMARKRKLERYEQEQFANRLLSMSPDINLNPELYAEDFEQFLIYNKSDKKTYCTWCREFSDVTRKQANEYAHGKKCICPSCNRTVTGLSEGLGRQKRVQYQNFVKFHVINENEVIILPFQVMARFSEPRCKYLWESCEGDLEYTCNLRQLYYLSSDGECREFEKRIHYDWLDRSYSSTEWHEYSDPEKEPTFYDHGPGMTSYICASYIVKGEEVDKLRGTFLKYAVKAWENYTVSFRGFVRYLVLNTLHPNANYLMNGGFAQVVFDRVNDVQMFHKINWRSDNLRKMMHLNKEEVNHFAFNCDDLDEFYVMRSSMKDLDIKTFELSKHLDVKKVRHIAGEYGMPFKSVLKYVDGSRDRLNMYYDYLWMARKLGYDMNDTMILKPKELNAMHDRCMTLVDAIDNEELYKNYKRRYKKLQGLVYRDEELGLQIVVPRSALDIKREGQILHHCVGGYAARHLEGTTTILFIRKIKKPFTPYYTLELKNDGNIGQWYGYGDNRKFKKPKALIEFVKRYQDFIDKLWGRQRKVEKIS